MYITYAAQNQENVNYIRHAMKSARRLGNFHNLFMYTSKDRKIGIKFILLSKVTAKDEYMNIKNVIRDDMMAVDRVPPQTMGAMPINPGGWGCREGELRLYQKRIITLAKTIERNKYLFKGYIMLLTPY
ncbi:TPA: capsid portal protein [Enterobacter cancerogenus]|nr:capsid portal protein [Enterobacter cancerogenus]